MENAGEMARENQALRQRLSRLSEASLRISEGPRAGETCGPQHGGPAAEAPGHETWRAVRFSCRR